MTTFWLKVIAMATMVIDHAAIAFFNDALWLRVIGRLAFLIYAFLMAEGFRHYKDDPDRVRKHFLRLTLVMIVSEFACDYFDKQHWVVWTEQSVIPTLWLGLLGIWFYERYKDEGWWLSPIAWAILAWVSYKINSQYKVVGVLLIVVFYLYREWEEKKGVPAGMRLVHYLLILAVFVVCHVYVEIAPYPILQYFMRAKRIWPLTFGMLATAIPLALYNGKPGYKNRVLNEFYGWFYPLQFFVMIAIASLL